MPRPVGAATSQEGRVVDDDDLAEPLEVCSVERGEEGREIALAHPSAGDDRPGEPADRVDGDERRVAHDAHPQRAGQIGMLLLGEVLFEEPRRSPLPGIAVVVSGERGEARGVVGERAQRFARPGELLRVAELGEIAGANSMVGLPADAGDAAELLLGVVEKLAAALPQFHGSEGAERPQLVERPLPPPRQLHVGVGEMEQLHRSATASMARAGSIPTTVPFTASRKCLAELPGPQPRSTTRRAPGGRSTAMRAQWRSHTGWRVTNW